MELLDDIEFFDCMDTCPDVFSLLDESDINFIEYSNDELFTGLSISEEPVCKHLFVPLGAVVYYCALYFKVV